MSDDLWGTDEAGAQMRHGGAPSPGDGPLADANDGSATGPAGTDATSLLVDFATGGIVGLIQGLDAQSDDSDPEVDDPEALRRAEEAVAHDRPIPVGPLKPIDEAWSVIAMQDGPGYGGLEAVAAALDAEGVPVGWDPYDPADAVSFMWPGTQPAGYRIQVPASEVPRARQVLSGPPLAGVQFVWDAAGGTGAGAAPGAGGAFGGRVASGGAIAPGFEAPAAQGTFEVPLPTPVTAYGEPALSDNERMERMASGGGSGAAWLAAVAVALIVAGAVILLVLKV